MAEILSETVHRDDYPVCKPLSPGAKADSGLPTTAFERAKPPTREANELG